MNTEELIKDYKKLLEKHGVSNVAVVQSKNKTSSAAASCPPGQQRVRVVLPNGRVIYVCM